MVRRTHAAALADILPAFETLFPLPAAAHGAACAAVAASLASVGAPWRNIVLPGTCWGLQVRRSPHALQTHRASLVCNTSDTAPCATGCETACSRSSSVTCGYWRATAATRSAGPRRGAPPRSAVYIRQGAPVHSPSACSVVTEEGRWCKRNRPTVATRCFRHAERG